MTTNNWISIGRQGGTGTVNLTAGSITKNPNTNGNITFSGNSGTPESNRWHPQ